MNDIPFGRAMMRLYNHISPSRRLHLLGLLILMLVGAFAELATLGAVLPFLALMTNPGKAGEYPILQQLFSALGWQDPQSILLPATLLFGAIAITAAGIRILLVWVSNKVVLGLGHDLGVEIYRRTLHQPYQFHVSRNTSEIIAGVNTVQLVIDGVLHPLMQAIVSTVIAITILAALIAIDPVVALLAGTSFTALYLLITLATRRKLRRNGEIIAQAQATRIQAVQEGLGGIRDVLIDHSQGIYLGRFRRIDARLRHAQAVNNTIRTAPRFLIESTGMLLIAVLAYVLSQREGGLAAAIPVLGALAIGAQKLLPLMQLMYYGWASVAGHRRVISDVVKLVELPVAPDQQPAHSSGHIPFTQAIELRNVTFRYSPDGPEIIKSLNLRLPKGSRVGFIGKTGSGKSTTIDILMGLLEPTEGSMLIDDTPLNQANRRGWQAHIAHVPQVIYLADATIAENIAFGIEKQRIDINRVREAARKAHIADYIETLPEQYQTPVGERGVRLSGGQRQRIGIARALYKEADVLIFDEATSALDDQTETAVIEAIQELSDDLTVIMIAHRLTTLAACDQIIELSAGQVTRKGAYGDVITLQRMKGISQA